ncbi:MAG TPA: adenylosuccinate synthetase [Candidatus Saccharimonadales bacterium]|nr:adenylosuccinate synthetase [Candidatus Saccharimonadales bacterium]
MRNIPRNVDAVIGAQWGDEGKGKIVDALMSNGEYHYVARAAGGPNAGHTIYVDGKVYKFHGLPEGALYPGAESVIGPGAVVDPVKLTAEIKNYRVGPDKLLISNNTHLITPFHVSRDEIREAGRGKQGSTKSGLAYVAADKYEREGIQLETIAEGPEAVSEVIIEKLYGLQQLRRYVGLNEHNPVAEASEWIEAAKELLQYKGDTTIFLNRILDVNGRILASGAQSHWLDINEQPYPWGSSTHTGIGGIVDGLKIPAQSIGSVIGVMKGIKSRVGGGPMATEIYDQKLANRLRQKRGEPGAEYGTTSGRPRRVGYLDLPEVRRSIMANGINSLALTKLDQLPLFGRSMLVAVGYEIDYEEGTHATAVAPNNSKELDRARPAYEEVGLWSQQKNERVRAAKELSELPLEAQKLIRFIEEQLDIDINFIGTGVDRKQIIVR